MKKGSSKKQTPNYPPFLILVRAIIKDKNGQVLLLKRSADHIYYPNQWELPGQRFVSQENIPSMLQKGVNNETNLIVEITGNNFYCQSRYINEGGKYQGANYIEIVGEVKYLTGKVKIGNDHVDWKWVPLPEVFDMDLSIETKKTLTQYLSNLQRDQTFLESRLPVLVTARGLIKNTKGQYLMLKRAKGDTFGGMWDLPGGKLNNLEILSELLKREIFEETGLVIHVDKPALYIDSHVFNQGKYTGYTFINLVSSAHVTAGEIILSSEHEDYGWFTKEKIFDLEIAPHIKLPLSEILLKHTV